MNIYVMCFIRNILKYQNTEMRSNYHDYIGKVCREINFLTKYVLK